MESRAISKLWFEKWEIGDFYNIPVTDDFVHSSPYGTIRGKSAYMNIIQANRDKFLGHRFEIYVELYKNNKACIRYAAIKDNFRLEVTEWHYA